MSTEDACKLYVGGLVETMTEESLRQVFEDTGVRVEYVSVPRDRETGLARGFGFVTLASEADAKKARESLDSSYLEGRTITVREFHADPPGKRERGPHVRREFTDESDRTAYMGNLPYDCSQEELIEFIGDVAEVERISLPKNPSGQPRGFGFVTFKTAEQANAAIAQFNGMEFRGRRLVVNQAKGRGSNRTERRAPAASWDGSRASGPSVRQRSGSDVSEIEEIAAVPRKTFDGGRRRSAGGRAERENQDRERRGGRRGKQHRSRRANNRRDDYYYDDD